MVLALVEEQAGLLPAAQVDARGARRPPRTSTSSGTSPWSTETTGSRPSSVRTRGSLRSTMPFGLEQLHERGDDLALRSLRGLRQRLDHEVVAVAVDHERRQPVALAVDDAVRLGPRRHRRAPAERPLDPLAPEAVGQRLAALDHAQPDLRARRPEREAERLSAHAARRARPRPGWRRRRCTTSERNTHGWPRSMRASPLRLTTTGPSICNASPPGMPGRAAPTRQDNPGAARLSSRASCRPRSRSGSPRR